MLITTACAALLAAWRWELPGAILSLVALGAFDILIRGNHTFHAAIVVMTIPGILFCLDWFARRGHAVRHPAREQLLVERKLERFLAS